VTPMRHDLPVIGGETARRIIARSGRSPPGHLETTERWQRRPLKEDSDDTWRQESMHYARVGTLVKPRVLLRGFLFVLRALIYFAIFAELVLLVYVLEAIA